MAYIGEKPSQTLASPTSQYFNGDGSTVAFTLNRPVNVAEELEVFVNNIQQEPGVGKSYTATGTTLTFDAAPSAGTANVYVVYRGLAEVTTRLEHDPNAALAATTGTFSGAVSGTTGTFSGDLTVDTDTLYVDSTNDKVGIGTTSPRAPLHLYSSAGASDDFNALISQYRPNIVLEDLSSSTTDWQLFADGGNLQVRYGDASTDTKLANEAMRIDSSGRFYVGTTDGALYNNTSGQGFLYDATAGSTQMLRSGGAVLLLNRASSDGSIVVFYQNGSPEGSVSVSGTTVSFNGGHLARWSRLADNNKDTSIVKGTVMTNLDEMVEWGDEDNEQLNKMAVSSVEGDVNVSGVFVNWDEDDDWNDMNIAMTGDMVIRIAQGTTVQRGDLLMSAGDGTAKPQGDDIVRSKTIAKVTSASVSHTYDDGTYLVPCVLMAC